MSKSQYLVHDYSDLLGFLKRCPEKNKIIGLLIDNYEVCQEEWLNPFADYLNSKGYITIGLLTEKSRLHVCLAAATYTAHIASHDVENLSDINVFVISDMDAGIRYPERSLVFGWMHAFVLAPGNTYLAANIMTLGRLDAFLIPFPVNQKSRRKIKELWSRLLTQTYSLRKRRSFYVIPCGYPRMKLLSEKISSYAGKPNAIIYAPAKEHYREDMGGNRLAKYGSALIEELLCLFPENDIIFRPYLSDISTMTVNDIASRFSAEEKFHIDTSPFKETTFAKGCLLITNISHIGQTFTSATLRPALLYRPWEKGKADITATESGFILRTKEALVTMLHRILTNPEIFAAFNRCARSLKSVPFLNAFAAIESVILDLCAEKPQKEWVEIQRFSDCSKSEAELARSILGIRSKDNLTTIFACLLLYHNPASALFAALTFHTGLAYFPGGTSRKDVLECVSRLLGKKVAIDYIGQFPPNCVLRLYAIALRDCLKKHDQTGVQFIQIQIEKFRHFLQI